MKNFFIILFVMLAATQAFAKKDKKDAKDMKIDSLVKVIDSLRVHYDSLARVNGVQYDSVYTELQDVYTILREKVIKREFDKSKLPHVIDSLISLRDSAFTKYNTNAATLMDSLASLKKDNARMKTMFEGNIAEEASKNRVVYELKQLKELLDTKILSQAEFDALKKKVLERW